MNRFYVVWNEKGYPPNFKHSTETSARAEAERLASVNRGQSFHVLASIGTAVTRIAEWTSHTDETCRDDEISF